jgi:carbamoyltransferase
MRAVDTSVRVLGLSGGCNPTHGVPDEMREVWRTPEPYVLHDAAAVVISDGRIVAAIEEERLNRLKHTNRLAGHAIRECLKVAGVTLDDVTRIAYYGRESEMNSDLANYMLRRPHIPAVWSVRDYLAGALSHELEAQIDPARLEFVEHHLAHAAGAYWLAPFTDALVVTLDGVGDGLSGTVWAGQGGELRRLRDLPRRDSLGLLYLNVIRYLGYTLFDEYKVMGLAAYGDPRTFAPLFSALCELGPNGQFEIKPSQLSGIRDVIWPPRRPGEPVTKLHQDIAAALQGTVERATMHLLEHYRHSTRLRNLCMAGGVAHNSTMIGKIARSGLFEHVFVQPASHDAGCALGAAVEAYRRLEPDVRIAPMSDVYLGRPLTNTPVIGAELKRWTDLVEVVRLDDPAQETAGLLADGAVIGWVQGRSEFGPRALGNRSILADPRPSCNKDRINAIVKHREAYRPFAPAVLEEYADVFFEVPSGACAAFMTFTVEVKEAARPLLGAITHVDGTARLQTVSRATNPRFWNLIEAFRQRTGIPVLLNTSFNHSIEPIVDSVDDALTCFLTTGLTHLIVDAYLVTKRPLSAARVWRLTARVPEHVRITHARERDASDRTRDVYQCEHTAIPSQTRALSAAVYALLMNSNGTRPLCDLIGAEHSSIELVAIADELENLWAERLIQLLPAPVGAEWAAGTTLSDRSVKSAAATEAVT